MAVRVRLRIEPLKGSGGAVVEAVALVNSGYEAEDEECALPVGLAERLGLWPPPADARRAEYRGFTGSAVLHEVPAAARVSVLAGDREGASAVTRVVLSTTDDEVLVSDFLGGALGLVLVDIRTGIWRFSDDAGDVCRRTEAPQRW
ncbi:MAG: hypothetical protein HY744_03065 [Deltaproteobacteria bacterium]|nr:hypothetical protein [Deltaproteobacteria bacterium]